MPNRNLIVIGGSVTALVCIVFVIVAIIGGLRSEVRWEKKAQRHVMAQGVVGAVQKMAKENGISDSVREVPGHYSDFYLLRVISSGKRTIGIAQDIDNPKMAVVAWQDPLVDTTTFFDADLKLSKNGKLTSLEEAAMSNLKDIKFGSQDGVFGYHKSKDNKPSPIRVIGTGSHSGVISLATNRKHSVGIAAQLPYEESHFGGWLWHGKLSRHQAVALHRIESAQPIDPYL